jgi:hypothetical protein
MEPQHLIRPEEAYFLWKTSWICVISSAYAAYRGHWSLVPVPAGVFTTSLLYWSRPNVAWRRKVDMTYVLSAFMYQNYMAWGAEYVIPFYALSVITCACYPVSNHLFRAGRRWESMYFHAAMHVLANICNIILYSGALQNAGD